MFRPGPIGAYPLLRSYAGGDLCRMPQRGNGLQRLTRQKTPVFEWCLAFSRGIPYGGIGNLAALQCPCVFFAFPDPSVLSLIFCLASVCVIAHAYPKNV